MRSLLLLVALLSAAEWALAQSHSRPDPADPSAPTPLPRYQSAFPDYRPFREQKSSWKQVNQEVADSPVMDSMQHKPGATMPGMHPKTGDAPKGKGGTAGHDMGSMRDMPAKTKPGTDPKSGDAPKAKAGTAGHDMSTMNGRRGKTMPGMDQPAATAPMSKEGHDTVAMAKPQTAVGQPANAQTARITGTGSVRLIDKPNGRVRLTHDPIATLGWPKMTMFLRLKDRSLADQIRDGDRVEFTLEKTASGYVIAGFKKENARHGPMK